MVKNKNNIKFKNIRINKIYYEALKNFCILKNTKDSYEAYRIKNVLEEEYIKYKNFKLSEAFKFYKLIYAYQKLFLKIKK